MLLSEMKNIRYCECRKDQGSKKSKSDACKTNQKALSLLLFNAITRLPTKVYEAKSL